MFVVTLNYLHSQLPTAIADNAGYDSSELVANLRAAHAKGNNTAGLGEYGIEIHVYLCIKSM